MKRAYERIFNVANSICKLFDLTMTRLDIQKFKVGSIEGYAGYLDIEERGTIIIRGDGTFEYR